MMLAITWRWCKMGRGKRRGRQQNYRNNFEPAKPKKSKRPPPPRTWEETVVQENVDKVQAIRRGKPKSKIIRTPVPVTLQECNARSVYKPESSEEKMVHSLETSRALNYRADMAALERQQEQLGVVLNSSEVQNELAKNLAVELGIPEDAVLVAIQQAVKKQLSPNGGS